MSRWLWIVCAGIWHRHAFFACGRELAPALSPPAAPPGLLGSLRTVIAGDGGARRASDSASSGTHARAMPRSAATATMRSVEHARRE